LAWSKAVGDDEDLVEEADAVVCHDAACSDEVAGGSWPCRARIALDAAPYLAC
jgi:hypothetical protein